MGDESVNNFVKVIIVVLVGVLLVAVTQFMPAFGDPESPVPAQSGEGAAETLRWLDAIAVLALAAASAAGIGVLKHLQRGEGVGHE